MKKNHRYILLVVLLMALALGIYIATYPKIISWEVVSEENKAKFVEVLNKQNITFTEETDHLGRKWVTVRGYDMDQFEEITKEYYEWYHSQSNTQDKLRSQ